MLNLAVEVRQSNGVTLTPEQRAAAKKLVSQFERVVAADEFAATALGPHVVVVLDPALYDHKQPESIVGAMSIEGIWPDYMSAADAAQAHAEVLNDGYDEVVFVSLAVPIRLNH